MNESSNKPIIFLMFVVGTIGNFLLFPLFAEQEVGSLIGLFMLSFYWIAFGALWVDGKNRKQKGYEQK